MLARQILSMRPKSSRLIQYDAGIRRDDADDSSRGAGPEGLGGFGSVKPSRLTVARKF